jgi:hypothetical protein
MTQLQKLSRISAMAVLAFVLVPVASALAASSEKASTGENAKPQTTQGSPLTCTTNVAVTPTLRSEGLTELVGDIVLNCTGGQPLPTTGAQIPLVNLSLTLGGASPGASQDALLVIDNPGTLKGSDGSQTPGVVNGNTINFIGVPLSEPAPWTIGGITFTPQSAPQGGPIPIRINFSGQAQGGQAIQFTPPNLSLSPLSAPAAGGEKPTTVNITDPNAQLFVILGKGPKGTTPLPVSGTPSQGGQEFKIDPQVFTSNSAPLPDGLTLYDCGDNITVAAPPDLPPDKVPCPNGKTPKAVGYIPRGGSATISGGKLIVSSGGAAGPVPAPATPAARFFTVQIGGGFGLDKYSGANNCKSIFEIDPTAPCSSGTKAPAGNVEVTVKFGKYIGIGGGYTRAGEITRNAEVTAGGSTFMENSKFGKQYETVGGQVSLPIDRVTLSFEGGAAIWQFRETANQSTGTGGSSGTVTTKFGVNGVSPEVGAKMQIQITNRFGAQVQFQYFHAQDKPTLNENNKIVVFGFYVVLR